VQEDDVDGTCSTNEREEERVYVIGGKEKKTPLGRPRRRCVDNLDIDLVEIGSGGVDCIGLAQDRDKWGALVIAVMNLRVL
jgi:hypothetical protein